MFDSEHRAVGAGLAAPHFDERRSVLPWRGAAVRCRPHVTLTTCAALFRTRRSSDSHCLSPWCPSLSAFETCILHMIQRWRRTSPNMLPALCWSLSSLTHPEHRTSARSTC